ncbi:MAG TPA: AAA family ATPase [Candidatus Methanoperedens sp.]|nr:AAA family ATPase [Candidatus Methanoperedens sp.]
MKGNRIICITGLCGSGKSVVSDFLVNEKKYQFLRFGQITLDEVKRRGLEPSEALEKEIREGIREKYGMAAYAILNLPKFDELIKRGNVVGDGLYSFEEYKVMKEHFGDDLKVIAVYAPPSLRYKRISERVMPATDTDLRHRPITVDEAKKRDMSELEKLNKGGTIAMADYTIVNTGDVNSLLKQINEVVKDIERS